MAWLYKHCRALIAASYEDYGLTPIEAGVWGRPERRVELGRIPGHRRRGSHRDIFRRADSAAIAEAIDRFESMKFDPDKVRAHVNSSPRSRYAGALQAAVHDLAARAGCVPTIEVTLAKPTSATIDSGPDTGARQRESQNPSRQIPRTGPGSWQRRPD